MNNEQFYRNIKDCFYSTIIDEYSNIIKGVITDNWYSDLKDVWDDLAITLGLDKSSRDRYRTGKNKKGFIPTSNLDGREEPHEPGFEQLFHYAAAKGKELKFQEGRVIINRSVASILTRVHRRSTNFQGDAISPEEVEILRFLRFTGCGFGPHQMPSISINNLKMSRHFSLMGIGNGSQWSDEAIADMFYEWNDVFDIVAHSMEYPAWLGGN